MAKKQAKAKTVKLRRQIAGVKIGKELRAAVKPVLRFASHPLVGDILAAALLVGADALNEKGKGGGKGKAASAGAVGAKGAHPVGLVLAIAAGEIASRIVDAYDAPTRSGVPAGRKKRTPAKKGRRISPRQPS